jgi:hypothetical protein
MAIFKLQIVNLDNMKIRTTRHVEAESVAQAVKDFNWPGWCIERVWREVTPKSVIVNFALSKRGQPLRKRTHNS